MIELITAIALLCQTHPAYGDIGRSTNQEDSYHFQLHCQQQYIKCMESKTYRTVGFIPEFGKWNMLNLRQCILERKVK